MFLCVLRHFFFFFFYRCFTFVKSTAHDAASCGGARRSCSGWSRLASRKKSLRAGQQHRRVSGGIERDCFVPTKGPRTLPPPSTSAARRTTPRVSSVTSRDLCRPLGESGPRSGLEQHWRKLGPSFRTSYTRIGTDSSSGLQTQLIVRVGIELSYAAS